MTSTMNYLICCYSSNCFNNSCFTLQQNLSCLVSMPYTTCCKNRHDERAAALYCRLKTKIHFKHTFTAVTTVGISYSKSLVMTGTPHIFLRQSFQRRCKKRTTCGCRRVTFLSSISAFASR